MEIYRHRGKAGEHDACRLGASDVRTAFISNGTGVATSRFVRLSAGGRWIRTIGTAKAAVGALAA